MLRKLKTTEPPARSPRTAGHVDWQMLSDEELTRPGATLMNLILAAATERRLSMREVAEALGLSYNYFMLVRNGKAEISTLGDEHIKRAAHFLHMPKVRAMLAAGQLTPADFYIDPDIIDSYLQPALQFVQRDPQFAGRIPTKIVKEDPDVQLCVIHLYETATGRSLIPGRVSHEEIAKRHATLTDSNGPEPTLMNLILAAATDRRLTMKEVAEALGLSYNYFLLVRKGNAEMISKLSDEHIRSAARFLHVPKVSAMLAAGQLTPADFYFDSDIVDGYLQPALQFVQRDPQFAGHIPAKVMNEDPDIQRCLIHLYDTATGRRLIPGQVPQ